MIDTAPSVRIRAKIQKRFWEQLEREVETLGFSRDQLINEALEQFLYPEKRHGDQGEVLKTLIDGLRREVRLQHMLYERTNALLHAFIRNWFHFTSELSDDELNKARSIGERRYEQLLAQLGLNTATLGWPNDESGFDEEAHERLP